MNLDDHRSLVALLFVIVFYAFIYTIAYLGTTLLKFLMVLGGFTLLIGGPLWYMRYRRRRESRMLQPLSYDKERQNTIDEKWRTDDEYETEPESHPKKQNVKEKAQEIKREAEAVAKEAEHEAIESAQEAEWEAEEKAREAEEKDKEEFDSMTPFRD